MVFRPVQIAVRVCFAFVALSFASAGAAPMLPCGWQGDEVRYPRPVDGTITAIASAPGAARLQTELAEGKGGAEYCGAVVLAAHWVLTARHCVAGKVWRDMRVTAGTEILQQPGAGAVRHVAAAYCAPRRSGALTTDIALLRLEEPFPHDTTFATLATLAQTLGATFPFTGTIASWPVKYRNPDPQPVLLSTFDVFSRDAAGILLARSVEAGKSPPCSGESGSGLWQETTGGPVLRGILSAVSSESQGDGAVSARDICRAPDMVAHITDTARQFAWIRETMDICDASADACPVRP